jgi:hypothetical protein
MLTKGAFGVLSFGYFKLDCENFGVSKGYEKGVKLSGEIFLKNNVYCCVLSLNEPTSLSPST